MTTIPAVSRTAASQAPDSLMPDHSALTMDLATRAFQMIDRTEFHVSAVLSVDKPESLKNFGTLESILLMAYEAGQAAAKNRPAEFASDVLS